MSGQQMSPLVIAISGTSGAGKTTLAQKVTERLQGAARLDFDWYMDVWTSLPLPEWVEAGADPSQKWQTPQLASDLRDLRNGKAITLPKFRYLQEGRLEPAPYIVLTEPYGRSRRDVAPYIDFVVGIYLPLDIALARRLLRDKEWVPHPSLNEGKTAEERLEILQDYLGNYLTGWIEGPSLRYLYHSLNDCARNNADLTLDGLKSPNELADEVVQALDEKFQSQRIRS